MIEDMLVLTSLIEEVKRQQDDLERILSDRVSQEGRLTFLTSLCFPCGVPDIRLREQQYNTSSLFPTQTTRDAYAKHLSDWDIAASILVRVLLSPSCENARSCDSTSPPPFREWIM